MPYGVRTDGSTVYVPVLTYAVVRRASPPILDLIVENGGVLTQSDIDGWAVIHYAVLHGNIGAIDWILSRAADPVGIIGDQSSPGLSAIHLAAASCRTAILQRFLLAGADASGRAQASGTTPLMKSAEAGCVEGVESLLGAGAGVSIRDVDGRTALHYAAKSGVREVVEAVLRAGAEVETQTGEGATPLMFAARSGNPDAVRVVLNRGAAVNRSDTQGRSPLLWACMAPFPDLSLPPGVTTGVSETERQLRSQTVLLLLDAGADAAHTDRNRRSAWEYASTTSVLEGTDAFWVLSDLRF